MRYDFDRERAELAALQQGIDEQREWLKDLQRQYEKTQNADAIDTINFICTTLYQYSRYAAARHAMKELFDKTHEILHDSKLDASNKLVRIAELTYDVRENNYGALY